jgi:hypothetical protein
MKPAELRHLSGAAHCHQCAPRAWNTTVDVTGDYDLDAKLARVGNKDLPHRLELYVKRRSYGKRTGYSGYRGTDD